MFRVAISCVTMVGAEYALFEEGGAWVFPHGELAAGEAPAEAVRRVVRAWTGTEAPKVELADLRVEAGTLRLVFRAVLTSAPSVPVRRVPRMGLPAQVGALSGADVEEMLKTSLSYKLTRT